MYWPEGVAVVLDKASSMPLHVQITNSLIHAESEGLLPSGTKLPSVRIAANLLEVNPGTVAAAYRSLVRLGWLKACPGSGYIVPERVRSIAVTDIPDLADELYSIEDIEWMGKTGHSGSNDCANMASSTPLPDPVTERDLREAFIHVLSHGFREALSYQEPLGFFPLRLWLSEWLKADKVEALPENIQIISGAQQGLDIIGKAMLSPGDTVLVEYPTYPGAVAVFRSRGASVVGVPVEADGMDPERVREMLRKHRPKLIYLIPNHQNPTGAVYSHKKLVELLKLAEAYNCYIVEDDYLRELQYDGAVPLPLKSLDEAGRVIFVKSHSKLLMPGLRIAYMAVPPKSASRLALAKHTTDIFTSGLIQHGFHRFCETGGWDRHLERMKKSLAEQNLCAYTALRGYLPPEIQIKQQNGGLSYWLELPEWADPEALYRAAGAKGVHIVPDSLFYDEGIRATLPKDYSEKRHVRLSFGSASAKDLERGAAVLGDCLDQMKRSSWKQVKWVTT